MNITRQQQQRQEDYTHYHQKCNGGLAVGLRFAPWMVDSENPMATEEDVPVLWGVPRMCIMLPGCLVVERPVRAGKESKV